MNESARAFVYAAQSPYFTVSERGEGAVWLSDSAINIFGDEDNKELTLVVTVSNEQTPTLLATATLYFRSAPRAIDGGALTVTIGDFRQRGDSFAVASCGSESVARGRIVFAR